MWERLIYKGTRFLSFQYIYTTVFSWDSVPNALLYEIQLSTDSAFLLNVVSKTTLGNQITWGSSLMFSTTYYWKVKASTANGMTDWKQDSFMTEPDIVSGIFESLYCLQTTTHTCAQF